MALTINKKSNGGSEFAPYLNDKVILPVKGVTTVSKKVGSDIAESQTEEVLNKGVMVDKADLFNINVTGGQTINLGNYNSAKISVSLTVPTTKLELEDAYEFATSWVSKKLEEALGEIKNASKNSEI